MRAHTVILGAGATMAAIPNGDKNGKKSSVMNGMISKLGLDDLLADVKLDTKSENIEDIYSELYMKPEYAEVVKELEKRLYDYFDSFEIPDTPTVYDFLILSLTEKDVIATFNWDPLLVQAYVRCYEITDNLPHLLCLHGNVGMGYCEEHREFGTKDAVCPVCKKQLPPTRLTELMSVICDEVYSLTPVINNEAMNRNEITATANNSRNKIVAALLRNELEPNLGLTGSGQEVSIMRSTLIRTGIWEENGGLPKLNLKPTAVEHMDEMLAVIEDFIVETRQNGTMSFDELYFRLTSAEGKIGLRKGLIPIYLAAVMHEYKREVIISDQFGQVALSAETLLQINSKPDMFTLAYLDWDPEKESFVNRLAENFAEYIVDAERGANSYDYVVSAMADLY